MIGEDKQLEDKQLEIKVGDTVRVIVEVWREDELPTATNFYTGKIIEVYERAKHCFYVRLENFDRLIPIDQVSNRIV